MRDVCFSTRVLYLLDKELTRVKTTFGVFIWSLPCRQEFYVFDNWTIQPTLKSSCGRTINAQHLQIFIRLCLVAKWLLPIEGVIICFDHFTHPASQFHFILLYYPGKYNKNIVILFFGSDLYFFALKLFTGFYFSMLTLTFDFSSVNFVAGSADHWRPSSSQ